MAKKNNNTVAELKKINLATLIAGMALKGEPKEYNGFSFLIRWWVHANKTCIHYTIPQDPVDLATFFSADDTEEDKTWKATSMLDALCSSLAIYGKLNLASLTQVTNAISSLGVAPEEQYLGDWQFIAAMFPRLDSRVKEVIADCAYSTLLCAQGSVSFGLTLRKALTLANEGKIAEMNKYLCSLTERNLKDEYSSLREHLLRDVPTTKKVNNNNTTGKDTGSIQPSKSSSIEKRVDARVQEILAETPVAPREPERVTTPVEQFQPEPPRIELPRIEIAPIKIPDVNINIQETRTSSGGGGSGGGKSSDGWTTVGEIIGGAIVVGAVGALGYWAYNKIFGDSSDEIELSEFGNGIDL
nr:MAG TPA: hypothetical protein [Caudoviricetes sp.]